MTIYHWCRVRARERSWDRAHVDFAASMPAESAVWGVFSGLFGLATNELFVVVRGDESPTHGITDAGFDIVATHAFEPTVRPMTFAPLTRPGVYVFRLFEVDHGDVDEIARLSSEAWTTFERTVDYQAEAQALFAQADRSASTGTMLLVTWYDGLGSWEASRSPAPEATENFRRRRRLIRSATAYATRLVRP